MKKLAAIILGLTLSTTILGGCGNTIIINMPDADRGLEFTKVETPAVESNGAEEGVQGQETVGADGNGVKTGISIVTSLEGSDATAEADGSSTANINIVAVTVDDAGIIHDCAIDSIKASVGFSAEGKLVDVADSFASKNELGEAYGMHTASSIGKEWNEQAEALARYAIGKTVEEVKNGAIDESGMAKDVDLASAATMYIGNYVGQIEAAVNNAVQTGAAAEDKLVITQVTNAKNSKDAGEEDGLTQIYATIAAITLKENTITSMLLDGVQANVNFNTEGKITSDLTANVATKNELGEAYGMKAASFIGKEWNEQAAAFCAYAAGKTVEEVVSVAVTEEGKAADADLAAPVTICIGGFLELVEKAIQ